MSFTGRPTKDSLAKLLPTNEYLNQLQLNTNPLAKINPGGIRKRRATQISITSGGSQTSASSLGQPSSVRVGTPSSKADRETIKRMMGSKRKFSSNTSSAHIAGSPGSFAHSEAKSSSLAARVGLKTEKFFGVADQKSATRVTIETTTRTSSEGSVQSEVRDELMIFICGPPPMMDDMSSICYGAGYPHDMVTLM